MPECKDLIYYIISSIGILITAIFSYLVWTATNKSNELAQASYKLSESIINSQKELKKDLKLEYARTLLKNAKLVKECLELQQDNLNINKIKDLPKSCGLNQEQIAEYFNEDERLTINNSWEDLDNYIEKYWKDVNGRYKVGFTGCEAEEARNKTIEPLSKFVLLLQNLEDILKKGD